MWANKWKDILIRFVEEELDRLDAFCKENHVKRTDVIRSATRLYIANRDLVNGVIKVGGGNGVETTQLLNGINELKQMFEALEKTLTSHSTKGEFTNSLVKARIAEAILKIKRRAKTETTTVDKLRTQLRKMDPSLAPFLFASVANGICPFDEVLAELQQRGELSRDISGIIDFNGDYNACRKKGR